MEFFNNIILGFQVVLDPTNLLLCFVGVVVGTLVGVLPGIGPVGAMALLLPATFRATPTSSIIMLAGVYYGSVYGGSTTSYWSIYLEKQLPWLLASMGIRWQGKVAQVLHWGLQPWDPLLQAR